MAEINIKSGLLAAVALLAKQGNSTTLEKFAVAIIAETIFFNDWSSINNADEISAATENDIRLKYIAKFIKSKCCSNQKLYKVLRGYNRESLYLLIETEWRKFDYEQCLIPSFEWAYKYDKQTGRISFDGFIEKKQSAERQGKEYRIIVPPCGDRVYCVTNAVDSVVEDQPQNSNNTMTNADLDDIKGKLDSVYKELTSKRGGDDCVKDFEYIWQWKITTEEYNKIKQLLESNECKKCIKEIYKTNVNYSFIIVAYVAEHYKREWCGNDGEDNALAQIGLGDNNHSRNIAVKYFGENSPKIYSSSITEWLDTLRMEGGLPINYIVKKAIENDNVQNNLVRITYYLYENVQKSIEILTAVTNQSLKHSYEKGYSLKKYIDTLLYNELESVCCVDSNMFKDFEKLLKAGRESARRNSKKFAYKYRIWKWGKKEFILHQSIVLKQDSAFGESQELISRERIKQWGCELDENDIFWLEINGKKYEFHPWKKDFYRSAVGRVEFPLPTTEFPKCNIVEDSIYFVNQKGEKKKINSIVKDNKSYIKFTSDNRYDWETGKSGELSAVLLLPKAKVELEHSEEICDVGSKLRWVEFSDRIKIDGKHVYSGKFNVHPKDEAVHSISKCKYIRSITYRKDDENHFIYLLNSSKIKPENFDLVRDDEDGEGRQYKVKKIRYKNSQASEWTEVDEKTDATNLCGLTMLDIDGQRLTAYILSEDTNVSREERGEEKGKVIVRNISGKVKCENCKVTNNDTNNQWHIEDSYDDSNRDRDNIIVDFISESGCVSLDIVRPLNRQDKMFKGHVIPAVQNVPRKLQSQYTLRIFDENGVRYIEDRDSECLYSNNEIRYNAQRCYYIAEGVNPTIDNNLEFVFISISHNGYKETNLTISEKIIAEGGRDKKYIYLENVPEEKGVIIQTLRNKMPEITYYKPYWCSGTQKYDFAQRGNRNKTSLDRLKLSVKHNLYFKELVYSVVNEPNYEITPKLLVSLFKDYCENHDTCDWNALWDMVFELDKDWMSIPRGVWCEFATDEEKKNLVCDLFKNRPDTDSEAFDRYVDNYWNLQWRPIEKVRRSNAYTFMQNIFGSVNEFYEVPNMDANFNEELDRLLNVSGKK